MDDFDLYLERYSICRKISKEEAKEHQLVKDVKAYYEEMEAKHDTITKLSD